MKYFDAIEILLSALYALSFGGLSGLAMVAIRVVFEDINRLLSIPVEAYRAAKDFSVAKLRALAEKRLATEAHRAVTFLYELLFFLAFGIGFILLSYFALDGEIRAYMLVLVVISYNLCAKTLGVMLEKGFRLLYRRLYLLLLIFLSVALVPIRYIISSIYITVLIPVCRRIFSFYCKICHRIIVNKKLKSVGRKLKNCAKLIKNQKKSFE